MRESRIVLARLLLLLVAASALGAGAASALRDRQARVAARYVCPMHPEVKSADRGQCPICGMALEAIGVASGTEMAKMPDLQGVENVRKHKILDFVRLRALPVELRERHGVAWVDDDHVVQAIFYRDQAEGIPTGERGSFTTSAAPAVTYAVRRTADAPVPWDRSTSRISFSIAQTTESTSLAPRRVGEVELEPTTRSVLAVPASAVVASPEGPYVLKLVPGFRFEKQRIEIGETFLKQGFTVVLSGLRAQDRVVARATFFLDADRRSGRAEAEEGVSAP